MKRRSVQAQAGAYEAVVADGFTGLGAMVAGLGRVSRVVLVTDDLVGPLWAEPVADALTQEGLDVVRLRPLPHGEAHKDRDAWWALVDGMLCAGVDRRAVVVAVGGGVLGDLAGFAAASVLRGLRWVLVPTTLLAMVDSSVGGKTGFNHPSGKNLIGAFHAPSGVWAPLCTLATLDDRTRRAGLAEVVKTALVEDGPLLDLVEAEAGRLAAGALGPTEEVVDRCVAAKARVVAQDEREAGRRAILNLGHTVGHAIEQVAGYGVWHHGEAVGMGLVAELAATASVGWTSPRDLPARVARLLDRLGLPDRVPHDLPVEGLRKALRVDKKADGAMLSLPVVVRPGSCEVRSVAWDTLETLLLP